MEAGEKFSQAQAHYEHKLSKNPVRPTNSRKQLKKRYHREHAAYVFLRKKIGLTETMRSFSEYSSVDTSFGEHSTVVSSMRVYAIEENFFGAIVS